MRTIRNKESIMVKLTRRGFMAATLATGALRLAPMVGTRASGRVILRLVYDKSLGMMRAVERIIP